jgi:hypothetical protein
MTRLILLLSLLAVIEEFIPVTTSVTWRTFVAVNVLVACVLLVLLKRKALNYAIVSLLFYGCYVINTAYFTIKYPRIVAEYALVYISIISIIFVVTLVYAISFRIKIPNSIQQENQFKMYYQICVLSFSLILLIYFMSRNYNFW